MFLMHTSSKGDWYFAVEVLYKTLGVLAVNFFVVVPLDDMFGDIFLPSATH